jgi:hypothetical protein
LELSIVAKRPGLETNGSALATTKGKAAWSYTSLLPYVFMAWYLSTEEIILRSLYFALKNVNSVA